jgi:DNA-binding SARP family transcriptional activator
VADVAGAVFAAVLAFSAVPAVLLFVVGNPLAGGLGHAWRPSSRDALCVLVLAAWIAWAACCAQLVRAVAMQVRRGGVAVRSSSLLDHLAARIALGVLACTSLGTTVTNPTGAGATLPVRGNVGVPVSHMGPALESVSSGDVTTAPRLVGPGETLWHIADQQMGDGADWTSIAALNLGREMGGGLRFVDPDHVRAGWRLSLPESTHTMGRGPQPGSRASDPLVAHLPELLILGLGSLTCAALARRAKRSRRGELFRGDLRLPEPSEEAVDTWTLVNRFVGTPALRSFEAANYRLGSLMDRRADGGVMAPRTKAVCVGAAGVTFWLASPDPDPPAGFESRADGSAWHVDHRQLDAVEVCEPHAPIALPVGDDDEGTWLIALNAGGVLPILGESGPDLWRAARTAQESWSWSDSVVVTDDPNDPALNSHRGVRTPGGRVLYFGEPNDLPPDVLSAVAVVTTALVAASEVTVLVDRHGASIHPLGRTVRPHLLSADRSRSIEELVRAPVATVRSIASAVPGPLPTSPVGPANGSGAAAMAPGSADVRLLTPTPRIDGLVDELAPNRSRRAVELVAYLALHHPDEITSDRLRTRVLGSSDADAAAKTLFNTAHAARRAMGLDENGDTLFPSGTRNGLYQVSARVTVDVRRALALVSEGNACQDPELAVAHLRAALELVEGEPLANALSGYAWWESEGHGARIGSVLVDAARSLAALATEAGQFDLARLGLDRASVVDPYSEALSRAAMEVAAAEGDADRLRHEWRECQRRVDALDPGSSPSTRTESLYGELSRRILVSTGGDRGTRRLYAPTAGDRPPTTNP